MFPINSLPAARMLLKHDFWSILDHRTYFASLLSFLNASMHSVSAIPVATGTRKQSAADRTPNCRIRSRRSSLVRRLRRLDPAALG